MMTPDQLRLMEFAWKRYPGQYVCFAGDSVVWSGGNLQQMHTFCDMYRRDGSNKNRPLLVVHPRDAVRVNPA